MTRNTYKQGKRKANIAQFNLEGKMADLKILSSNWSMKASYQRISKRGIKGPSKPKNATAPTFHELLAG